MIGSAPNHAKRPVKSDILGRDVAEPENDDKQIKCGIRPSVRPSHIIIFFKKRMSRCNNSGEIADGLAVTVSMARPTSNQLFLFTVDLLFELVTTWVGAEYHNR